jgi:DNA repair exonuclease SbcCD ATPase subunit
LEPRRRPEFYCQAAQLGELIGVISYVQTLKERISTRIQVSP